MNESPPPSASPSSPEEAAEGTDPVAAESSERRLQIEEAYEQVPEIGKGRRWYDFPYCVLHWFLTGWRRHLFPRRVRELFNRCLNYLIPFNEHDRHKLPGYFLSDDLVVPPDEHVTVSGLWVVELFAPSQLKALEAAIDRNRWDRRRTLLHDRETNRELLTNSRAGTGWAWWNLAEISNTRNGRPFVDGSVERLPTEFTGVQLRACQLGQGLTAVVARFWLTKDAEKALDDTLHAKHEPQLVRGGSRPRAETREFAAYRLTQEARRHPHDAARGWLAHKAPGFFAASAESQPLLDLLLMDRFDPLSGHQPDRETDRMLRALGLSEHGYLQRTSTDLPKLELLPTRRSVDSGLGTHRTLALLGQLDATADAAGSHLEMYGTDIHRALAGRYSEPASDLLMSYAVSEFLAVAAARYARLRDSAKAHHDQFSAKAMKDLREHLLSLSLDVSTVRRDLEEVWSQKRLVARQTALTLDLAPHIRERDEAEGRKPFEPIDLREQMREEQVDGFRRLLEADADYRDILSTAASIGASLDSARLGRRALWIAIASLLVAAVTVVFADVGDGSLLRQAVDWFGNQSWSP